MRRCILGLLFSLIVIAFLAGGGFGQAAKSMSVAVKEGQVRSSPSFLARIVARPPYGERVSVLETGEQWVKVALKGGVQGWIHASALTPKTIVLKAGAGEVKTSATTGEIALAGKGFNKEVEETYRAKNPSLDYRWIDKMERFDVSPEEMAVFLNEGGLRPAEGGRP